MMNSIGCLQKNVPGIGTIEYVYDITNGMNPGFTPQTIKYPSGAIVKKVYDKAGRLSQVVADNKTTQYNYYDNRSVQSVVYDNGAKEEYTYTANNLLDTLTNKKANGTIISTYSYSYDGAGNRLTETTTVGTDVTVISYTYDTSNKLTQTETKVNTDITQITLNK